MQMFKLQKKSGKPFILLNLTDPQLGSGEWENGHENGNILRNTVDTLMKRVKPDLVTVSGDISWSGDFQAYVNFADLMEKYDTPWAPVWGNHDNQGGPEFIEKVVAEYTSRPHCVYESGDPSLGNGNYTIAVMEGGRCVEGIIMMDSHDRAPYTDFEGNEQITWAKLIPEQLPWYEQQIKELEALGCGESTLIMHIPIYAYNTCLNAAFRSGIDRKSISDAESFGCDCWNEGYEDSFGVMHEGIGSYACDEGMFDLIKKLDNTRYLIAGHDHINNTVVCYENTVFIYGLKTGPGCYWEKELNGGTVLEIESDGVSTVNHEYVKV